MTANRKNMFRMLAGAMAALLQFSDPAAGAPVTLADFNNDYQATNVPANWVYQWNKNGLIGTAANYDNLIYSTTINSYNINGAAHITSGRSAYLMLGPLAWHPGRGLTDPLGQAYSIAGYRVPSSGPVFIDGSVRTSNTNSNGTEYRVYVGDSLKFARGSPGNASTETLFYEYLGIVDAGATVYFALGPNGANDNDSTLVNFRLGRAGTPGQVGVVGNFRDDYKTPTPPFGWRYFWNSNGAIGNTANYSALVFHPATSLYRTTTNAPDGDLLRISGTGGHTRRVSNNDRYAIAAFMVSADGVYQLRDTFVTSSSADGNGLHLFIHINSEPPVTDTVIAAGSTYTFDRDLVRLNAGDTIYICVGPNGNDFFDGFGWDFSIRRVPPGTMFMVR